MSDKTNRSTRNSYVIKTGSRLRTAFSLNIRFLWVVWSVFLLNPEILFAQNDVLWYTYPAKYWNSQALHLGNGHIGVSFFGGVQEEKFAVTEESIWLGGPFRGDWEEFGVNPMAREYLPLIRQAVVRGDIKLADSLSETYYLGNNKLFGSFSSLGDLKIKMIGHGMPATNYQRKLDLSKAIGTVTYVLDSTTYSRQYFCSYPDKVMGMMLKADKAGRVGFLLHMDVLQERFDIEVTANSFTVSGRVDGGDHRFVLKIVAVPYGGSPVPKTKFMGMRDSYWGVDGADSVALFLSIATDYELNYPHYKGGDPQRELNTILAKAVNKGFWKAQADHIEDYQRLYSRTSLDLPGDVALEQLPTNERYSKFVDGGEDIGLKEIAFNLGKYLIISSSRPGSLPANLQGKWNTFYVAPWAGNYQANINIQEIYWSCGPMDLLECQQPYIDWTVDLVKPGREVARRVYGTEGWVSHTTGNIWGHAAPVGGIPWGVYPLGSVWHCQHLWEQFMFSQDTLYLRETAYPVIKEAALFWTRNVTPYKGSLIVAPSISAEHGAYLKKNETKGRYSDDSYGAVRYNIPGALQDAQMIRDLFRMCIEASTVLGTDQSFRVELNELSKQLVPNKIGKHGQLQEWLEDIDSPEDHHRHISHLYAVCPGVAIHPTTTPKLAKAAKVSLNMRGDGRYLDNDPASGGNWSRCWRIWCWARLMDGNRADKIFDEMFREQGFENLLTHQQATYAMGRPDLYREPENLYLHFQLDASASTPGFIAEMLLQSHLDELMLLPALPDRWDQGSVTGLLARGGYKVDITWNKGTLTKAIISGPPGRRPSLRLGDQLLRPDDNRVEWLSTK